MAAPQPPLLHEVIAQRARATPDLPILTVESGGARGAEVRSYRELWDNGRRLAAALLARGLGRGEHFGLLMANHPEFVEAMIAASLTATVFVPIDARTRGEKLVFMLEHAECRGVIAADYSLAALAEVRASLPRLRWVIGVESGEGAPPIESFAGVVSYAAALPEVAPDITVPPPASEAPMQLLFTSGTTGDPKGIMLQHGRWMANAFLVPQLCGWQKDERPYSGLSLTHANAQVLTLGASLVNGYPCVLSRRFTKSRLWDITRAHGCTTFNLLGGMTTAIYSEPRRANDADNPVRFVLSAGMPAAIWEDFERRFGVKLLEFYGAAEGGMTFKPVGTGPIGSIGKPIPLLIHKIVDDEGKEVPRGEPGELLFRWADGTPITIEYFRNPEASARKCAGGWLHMGDIVREDADGWLFFLARKGGGIRRNGEFINTGFLEKVIAEFDGVDDVYVYGVPARSGAPGEKDVVAAVVPVNASGFDPAALEGHCRSKLEPGMVPSYIQVLEAIPKTASEKPQDRFLMERFNQDRERIYQTGA
ncbi:MAG TPA: AMP-binding protein [Steroidobacteraceae bacterium]|nr:AMP-binding protein [Steroidobacteraceae bacterium]